MNIPGLGELTWSGRHDLPGGDNRLCVFELVLESPDVPRLGHHLQTGYRPESVYLSGDYVFSLRADGLHMGDFDLEEPGNWQAGPVVPNLHELGGLINTNGGFPGQPASESDVLEEMEETEEHLNKMFLNCTLAALPVALLQRLDRVQRLLYFSLPNKADVSEAGMRSVVMIYYISAKPVGDTNALLREIGSNLIKADTRGIPATRFSASLTPETLK